MRDQDNLREFFRKHAAQTFSSEIQSLARNILIGAVLLSGAAFIINLGVTNIIRSSAISGTQLPIAINLIPESTEHKTSEVAFCRAKAETLARRYFFSNNQFKESFASQLATTYKIAPKDAKIIISAAAKTSKDHDIDPFLVLGIIAKESSFNKSARSGYGATGLMQVHAPSHKKVLKTMGLDANNLKTTEKILTSEIQINVKAGVQIYKQYEKQYGSRVKALQAYNGARNDTASKYAKNVLALRDGFSAQAAAPMGCDKAGYASVDHDKQKLASMQQKRNPA